MAHSLSRGHRESLRRRGGFSLLETLLAIAILLGSLAVLGELVRLGLRNAASARDATMAQLIAESLLNEWAVGARPVREVEDRPLPEALGWLYTLERVVGPRPGLIELRLSVRQDRPEGKRALEFRLTRWVRGRIDPERPDEAGESAQDETSEGPLGSTTDPGLGGRLPSGPVSPSAPSR